jgi:hypothetical protein
MEQPDLFSRRKKVRAPSPLEWQTQASVADTLDRWLLRDWRFTHIASGELRDKGTAAKLKRMGVRAGWPDFVLLGPPGLHCLEMKRKGERLSEDQQLFEAFCIGIGVPYRYADTFDGALAILKEWRCLKVNVRTGA